MDRETELELFGFASESGDNVISNIPMLDGTADPIQQDPAPSQVQPAQQPTPQQSAKHEKRDSRNEPQLTIQSNDTLTLQQEEHSTVARDEPPAISTAAAEAESTPEDGARVRPQTGRRSDGANVTYLDIANNLIEQFRESAQAVGAALNGSEPNSFAQKAQQPPKEQEDMQTWSHQAANQPATTKSSGSAQQDRQPQPSRPADTAMEQQEDMPPPTRGTANPMGPPAAPASMLYNLQPSDPPRPRNQLITDPFICSRLAFAVVTLFRMGRAKECKAIGQFAIDLMGEDVWRDEWLPQYMDTESEENAGAAVMDMLADAAAGLKVLDPVSSGFLGVLMGFVV